MNRQAQDSKVLVRVIKGLLDKQQSLTVAIDGPCGSGKSTLAQRLKEVFGADCAVIHADDFFLRPHQRSAERLAAPGGNMDRERLRDEVLTKLHLGMPFIYHRYDCQTGTLHPINLMPTRLYIVEGSYSLHPELQPYYDLKVFLDADAQTRLARLRRRVPANRMADFLDKWIPMEDAYFEHFNVRENSDLALVSKDEKPGSE